MRVRYITHLSKLAGLSEEDRRLLEPVAERYAFRMNSYYESLIDWDDPDDPLRRLVVPDVSELRPWGKLDASNEASYTPVRGCQHKYRDTALLLVNEVCGAYCRYCFRKRLFMNDNDDAAIDTSAGLAYIREHSEITNVLITGGDPLMLSTRRLAKLIREIAAIPSVRIIRIGTKMTAFNPYRILEDEELLALPGQVRERGAQLYFMNHFDHPNELTDVAKQALQRLQSAGAQTVNQCPLVRGVNDDAEALTRMFRELSFVGCPQYYLFQGRPTAGNEPYELPIVEGYQLFNEATRPLSGLAKRARYAMSHQTGKIEILSIDNRFIYMKYHRAHRVQDIGQTIIAKRDDEAYWLDELELVAGPPGAITHAKRATPRSDWRPAPTWEGLKPSDPALS